MQNIDQDIRDKAYEIWLLEGKPEGRSDTHWEMARQMVAQTGDTAPASIPAQKPRPRKLARGAATSSAKDQQLNQELKETSPKSDPPNVLWAYAKNGGAAEMKAVPVGRRAPKTPDPAMLPVDPAYSKKKK